MTGDGDLIGTVLDERWEVLEPLGRGGMGSVYRARHRHLGTDVAVKVLPNAAGLGPSDVARFYRESQLIGKLNHDHIIRVQDTGKTASGDLFFVMEYLRGPDLRTLLRSEGPLSWARTRAIVLQVCDALSAIHSSGVIHRDLKPHNIVLDPRRGRPDFVKLLDFGVAKPLGEDRQHLTQTGIVLGTLAYMGPEYLYGYPPDGRVDIYALGVIAFELLTGRLPAPNLAANSRLLQLQGVSAGAQEVIACAMARDPAQRFADAEAFAAALAALPEGVCPNVDEGTTTRFVAPMNGASSVPVDTMRRLEPPSRPQVLLEAEPHLSVIAESSPTLINPFPKQSPTVTSEPAMPTVARTLPETDALRIGPDNAADVAAHEEAAPAPASAEISEDGPLPVESSVSEPPAPDPPTSDTGDLSMPTLIRREPQSEASSNHLSVPSEAAQAEAAKPVESTALPARSSAAPRHAHSNGTAVRRILYALIILSAAALAYQVIINNHDTGGVAPPNVDPDTTGEPPPPPASSGSTEIPPIEGGTAGATGTMNEPSDTDSTGGSTGEPPPPPPRSNTGAQIYQKKHLKIRRAVKECGSKHPVIGVERLKMHIVLDGRSGNAEADVLEPALVKDEQAALCAVKKIKEIPFGKFEGSPFSKSDWFDLSK